MLVISHNYKKKTLVYRQPGPD